MALLSHNLCIHDCVVLLNKDAICIFHTQIRGCINNFVLNMRSANVEIIPFREKWALDWSKHSVSGSF